MSSEKHDKQSVGNDPHGSREQAKYDQPIASREFITSVLLAEKSPMDLEALAKKLGLSDNADNAEALRRRVGAMLRDGQLTQNHKRELVPVDADTLVSGRISAHPDGFGFVNTDDGDKDVYLSGKQMRQVLHGDSVVVGITGTDRKGRREGRIVQVVERANKSLVGRLSVDRGTVVVLPDNKRIHQNLLITPGGIGDAKDGDMVVAEIVDQPSRRNQPQGRVIEVLGQHLRPGMEIDVALHSHGIPVDWPDEVSAQAAAFSPTVDGSSIEDRNDVRALSLITIDGADARDFDDAVWCERLDNGWRLLVAIADVAHYVSPGSALDKEAIDRGTSVYFPGRVVPMLPEVLSNGLCSLNPDVDRLCMLCELTLDDSANVIQTQFHNGIMRSHARLTYDQVSEMLTDNSSELREKHVAVLPMIEELHNLYKALAKKRRKRGAIEFDSNETHIVFDDNKKIKEIIPIQRNDAHKLIEECMILANIEAAAFLEKREVPALYRVHAGPKSERLEDLREFLALRSLTLGGGDTPSALDYAALAEKITDRTDRSVIQTVMLRSMQQAVYQPKNEGHFGLALNEYAHFTSPIRRYPDLLVHRALKFAITNVNVSEYRYSKEAMQALGESCSMSERRAEDASRDVVAWLKCEYMQDHVGSDFPGVITAVTSFGLFVELVGIHVEGLVHITNLSQDYYRFEQAAHKLVGERTGTQYQLGDAIVVKVAGVNLEDRKIDFTEVSSGAKSAKHSEKPRRSKHNAEPVAAHGKKRKSKKQRLREAALRTQTATGANEATPATANDNANQKALSAEQKRQNKRRLKQKRRNEKRAAKKQAQRLESLRVESSNAGAEKVADTASTKAPVAVTKSAHTSEKQGVSNTHKADKKPAANVAKKSAKESSSVVAKNDSTKASVAASSKVAKNANTAVSKKVAAKSGSAVSKKAAAKAGSAVSKKVAAKTGAAVSKKVAAKTGSAVSKKVAAKAGTAVSKKVAAKTGSAVSKKVAAKTGSAVSKKVAKKASSAVNKKIAKKASSAVNKKIAKKASSAVNKKVAKKASSVANKKIAKKASSAVNKKVAKKASSAVNKKIAKKASSAVNKKVAKKASSIVNKKVAKKKSSALSKKIAKKANVSVAKKIAKKATSKMNKKVAKKANSAVNKQKANKKVAKQGAANKKIAKKQNTNVVKAISKKKRSNVQKPAGKKGASAAKRTNAGAAKKTAAKTATSSASKAKAKVLKATSNKAKPKAAKKIAKKTAAKVVKKTAKKVAQKITKKATKKVAKKSNATAAKKVAKKVTKKVAKRATGKASKKATNKRRG